MPRARGRCSEEHAYAEPTGRYADFHGALRCLISDTNLDIPPDPRTDFVRVLPLRFLLRHRLRPH